MTTDPQYGLTSADDNAALGTFRFNPATNTVHTGMETYSAGSSDASYGLTPANQTPSLADQIKANPWRVFQIPLANAAAAAGGKAETIGSRMLRDAAAGKDISTADYLKQFGYNVTADTAKFVSGMLSPEGMGVAAATALAPEVMGPLLVAHGGYKLATDPISTKPEDVQQGLSSLAEMAGGAATTGAAFNGTPTPIQDAWKASRYKLQRLSGAMLTPQEAAQVPAGSQQFAPPRAVSNQDVIDHAASEGIDLTPAQATKEKVARMVQGIGEQTLTPGGQQLQDAIDLNKGKLAQSIENFAARQDPHFLGTSPESAGEDLQSQAKVALEVAKDNAAIAYKQAGLDQANIAVDVRTPLQKFVDAQRNVRQPGAAVSQPEYKSPAVEAALQDIEAKIADPRLGPNASVQSVRNLRTELWEKGNDYTGTIPDAAKGIYRMASQIPDDAMMNAAKGTNFENSFRDASQQWADLKSKFDTPGEPLYKLLQSSDPKQAYNAITGPRSAADILKLKDAGVDLSPIQGQVIRDIASKNFRSSGNTLAGYPDSFLQSLFGPDVTRELYIKSEIGRRLNFEANPSGSGRLLVAFDQLGWNPMSWTRGETAARLSMPRNPNTFVSPTAGATSSAGVFPSLGARLLRLRALLGAGSASAGGAGQ